MAKAERTGAKTGNRTTGEERRIVDLGAVKGFEAIACGIAKRDQPADAPGIRQRLRLGDDMDLVLFQPAASASSAAASATSQPKKRSPSGHRAVDDDALLAVVHPERQQRIAALNRLQPDQAGAELPPVVEIGRSEPGISQSLQCHRASPFSQILRIFCRLGERCDPQSKGQRIVFPLPLAGEGAENARRVALGIGTRGGSPAPTLPRKREREPTVNPHHHAELNTGALDVTAAPWCLPAHEHRRPPNPSLVAHLLKVAGAISFLPIVEGRHRSATAFRLSCVAFPRQVS